MHKRNPADELAEIRAEIARLKRREAELRAAFLARPDQPAQGRWSRVEVVETRQSRFDPTLLPLSILQDPRFRCDKIVQIVRCLPLPPGLAPRPGWPIRREGAVLH